MRFRSRILIVEDDSAIREMLRLALELEGYPVTTASNGKEALALLVPQEKPSLILLDLMMPVMNGWEFVKALREKPEFASVPVVVVTAFGMGTQSIEAQDIINKPIQLDAFFAIVKKYCE